MLKALSNLTRLVQRLRALTQHSCAIYYCDMFYNNDAEHELCMRFHETVKTGG